MRHYGRKHTFMFWTAHAREGVEHRKRVKKLLKSMPGPGDMLVWENDRERIEQARL